ncbi:MAG: hypothetical protein HZC22_19400 [Rhodocyclales bacterium]|nr:hypothetical protein [Rhodocyclales bacterium]
MTIETTTTTHNRKTEAHQSADFLQHLPIQLELSNPWTISDMELREIWRRPDCSPEGRAYIAGVLAGRTGETDLTDEELRAPTLPRPPTTRAYIAGVLAGRMQARSVAAPEDIAARARATTEPSAPLDQALAALEAARDSLWAAAKAADAAFRASRDAGDRASAEGHVFRCHNIHRVHDLVLRAVDGLRPAPIAGGRRGCT